MTYTSTQTLSFEEFTARYGDDPRYELIDGELRALEPTGPHESVAVIVLDEAALPSEPLWQREPIITSGQSIRLVGYSS